MVCPSGSFGQFGSQDPPILRACIGLTEVELSGFLLWPCVLKVLAFLEHFLAKLICGLADTNTWASKHPILSVYACVRLVTETWSHFPWARERLFALLAGSAAKTPIILSGDTHYAEFAGTSFKDGQLVIGAYTYARVYWPEYDFCQLVRSADSWNVRGVLANLLSHLFQLYIASASPKTGVLTSQKPEAF